jgi:hypothetical protein
MPQLRTQGLSYKCKMKFQKTARGIHGRRSIFFELSGLLYQQGWRISGDEDSTTNQLSNPEKTNICLWVFMPKDEGSGHIDVIFWAGKAGLLWPSLKIDEFEEIENAIKLIEYVASLHPPETSPHQSPA